MPTGLVRMDPRLAALLSMTVLRLNRKDVSERECIFLKAWSRFEVLKVNNFTSNFRQYSIQ